MVSSDPGARSIFHRLLSSLSKVERRLLLLCIIITSVIGVLLIYQRNLNNTHIVPTVGGMYTEGIVANSLADVTPTLRVLTNVGLLHYNEQGELAPAAAKAWEVSPDGLTYTFALADGVKVETVRSILEEQRDLFPDIGIEVKDEGAVIFQLKQPFNPFLSTTTANIFPYGPYSVTKQEKGIVRLQPNPDSIVGKPWLSEVILRIYPDSFNLTQALSGGEIDGVSDVSQVENEGLLRRLQTFQIALPRSIYLFFNTTRDVVKSVSLREKLKNDEAVEDNPQLRLVTLSSPKYEGLAEQIVERWSKLGVRVIVETHTASELSKDIVPNRAYDVLIYGLDFGPDPDPYPFWHSSQIGQAGLNFSNFANIDADRILEKARQTSDTNERNKFHEQFIEIFNKEVPAIELEKVPATVAVSKNIKGMQSHPGASVANRYDFAEQWYQKTKRVNND